MTSGTGVDDEPRAKQRPDVRLRDAMPKPLLIVFVLVAVSALGIAVVLLIRPPSPSDLPLAERRSPPAGALSHDVGGIAPAPVPSGTAQQASPCSSLPSLQIEAGAAGQARLGAAVEALCRLTTGVPAELRASVLGLDGASIRFAAFDHTGEEATTDLGKRIVYVNIRFAVSGTATNLVGPVLAHEGWHLAHATEPVTARNEYLARVAELDACKQLIDRDKWIRNCKDASRIVALGEQRAVALLVGAGYAR